MLEHSLMTTGFARFKKFTHTIIRFKARYSHGQMSCICLLRVLRVGTLAIEQLLNCNKDVDCPRRALKVNGNAKEVKNLKKTRETIKR